MQAVCCHRVVVRGDALRPHLDKGKGFDYGRVRSVQIAIGWTDITAKSAYVGFVSLMLRRWRTCRRCL